ncbi:MAG: glycosyltransferase [Hyphomicrobiaceae bacterium]
MAYQIPWRKAEALSKSGPIGNSADLLSDGPTEGRQVLALGWQHRLRALKGKRGLTPPLAMAVRAGADNGVCPILRWRVSPHYRSEVSSSLITGFALLSMAGELSFDISADWTGISQLNILRFDVSDVASDEVRKFAIDEFDRKDRFHLETLKLVDVYFKRHFNRDAVAALPQELRQKVRPLGLTFSCSGGNSRKLLTLAVLISAASRLVREGVGGAKSALLQFNENIRHVAKMLPQSDFERVADDGVRHDVLFQTRLWPDEPDGSVDRSEVNRERCELVAALRSAFGSEDTIGIIPTAFGEQHAAHLTLRRDIKRSVYLRQLRSTLIAVNTQGLDGSPGLKVAEALAAGCALVSQPLNCDLLEPLLPGINYLPFETPEECVAQCRVLLANEALRDRMRAANADYFARFTRPDAHARNILALVLGANSRNGPAQMH